MKNMTQRSVPAVTVEYGNIVAPQSLGKIRQIEAVRKCAMIFAGASIKTFLNMNAH